MKEAYKDTLNSANQRRISDAFVTLAWYRLINRDPRSSIEASLSALALVPDSCDAAIDLVTAYLMND